MLCTKFLFLKSKKPFTVQYLQSTHNKPSICDVSQKGMITFIQSGFAPMHSSCLVVLIMAMYTLCQQYFGTYMSAAWTKD